MHVALVAVGDTFVQEALVAIRSLQELAKVTATIHVFTDDALLFAGTNVEVHKVSSMPAAEAAGLRLRIPDLLHLQVGDDVVYMDPDIVALHELPPVDWNSGKVHVYGYPHRTQREPSFAGFISQDDIILNQVAFNSGLLMFRFTEEIQEAFREASLAYATFLNSGRALCCWEQPFVNEVLCRRNLACRCLTPFVWELRNLTGRTDAHVLVHGCGRRGERLQELTELVEAHCQEKGAAAAGALDDI